MQNLMDAVPEPKRPAVARALESAFPGLPLDASERMPWGVSGAAVFKIEVAGQPYLLRVEGGSNELREAARHHRCYRIAAEADVAPALYHADDEAGIVITRFVAMDPAFWALPEAAMVEAVIAQVKRLHAAPLFPKVSTYPQVLRETLGHVRHFNVLPEAALAVYEGLLEAALDAVPWDEDEVVSSHNDLNPSNLLYDGQRVWLIDWEMSSAIDRYLDLATVANFQGTESAAEAVLRAYFGEPTPYQAARLFVVRQLHRLGLGSILLILPLMMGKPLAPMGQAELDGAATFLELRPQLATLMTPEGQRRFATALLEDARKALQAPRFAEAAAVLRAGR